MCLVFLLTMPFKCYFDSGIKKMSLMVNVEAPSTCVLHPDVQASVGSSVEGMQKLIAWNLFYRSFYFQFEVVWGGEGR